MARLHTIPSSPPQQGYHDLDGTFVPFSTADEIFRHAHKLGSRVLLRLWLDADGKQHGLIYTNDPSLQN